MTRCIHLIKENNYFVERGTDFERNKITRN